jgi:hypothetical protein
MNERYCCPCCWVPDGALLRWDRKQRPYVVCEACGMRFFAKSPRFLQGMGLMLALVKQASDEARRDETARAAHNAQGETFAAAFRKQLDDVANAVRGGRVEREEANGGPVPVPVAAIR